MKLLLVDDHELFRAGACQLLSKQSFVSSIDEASHGREALRMLRDAAKVDAPFDVMILDFDMPEMSGLDVLHAMVEEALGGVAVVMLTGMNAGSVLTEVIEAGVSAIVSKRGSGNELLDALALLDEQSVYLSDEFQETIRHASILKSLTRRENEVLQSVLSGLGNQELASQLAISYKTVETHKTRIMQKLDVRSTAELMAKAATFGLTRS